MFAQCARSLFIVRACISTTTNQPRAMPEGGRENGQEQVFRSRFAHGSGTTSTLADASFMGQVQLLSRFRQCLATHHEPDVLRDVGRMVADALYVLRDEEQVGAGGDAARVFHYVGQ